MNRAARLDPRAAPWLLDPAVRRVIAAFDPTRDQPRFVGGCVRNALVDAGPTDLDIAVLCPPAETIARLETAGLRAIPTGLDHGTITTVAETQDGEKSDVIEITTLRQDVETDGRRAVVAFTRDWAIDAARRDFTMNALYADPDGAVIDPLGSGLADLAARRVRFIGRAEERIREDYLRILRFFRFTAFYAEAAPDPADIAAIVALREGVAGLARERIGADTKKLFAAPDPSAALALMSELGVDAALYHAPLGRSEAAWRRLVAAEQALGVAPSWPRRLVFAFADRAEALRDDLRLSKNEAAGVNQRAAALTLAPHEAAYRAGSDAALDAALINAAAQEAPLDPDLAATLAAAAAQRFPVSAQDLIRAGLAPGPGLGAALAAAEARWIASGFRLAPNDLIDAAVAGA